MNKKLFFIAGERSGDLHGGNLISSIRSLNQSIDLVGWGGDDMKDKGMTLLKHYKGIAFMGFWEVIRNIFQIKKILNECKQHILEHKPDGVVLIDYGGFNMKISAFCKQNNIPVHYYISPKVWAWNVKRAYKIKECVDYLYCILPFEPTFFKKFDYKTEYVGNPVVDAVEQYKIENPVSEQSKNTIAVLPGSRKQEVTSMLQLMISFIDQFPTYEFIVTAVDNLEDSLYNVAREKGVKVVYNKTYEVLSHAKAAIVTSGTATLETALFNVPQVICYKTSKLTYLIAKSVLKVPYISLVNLIADKPVVKELIQKDYNYGTVLSELKLLLEVEEYRLRMFNDYKEIRTILGNNRASDRTAELILERL